MKRWHLPSGARIREMMKIKMSTFVGYTYLDGTKFGKMVQTPFGVVVLLRRCILVLVLQEYIQ